MKKVLLLFFVVSSFLSFAQNEHKSIHEEQLNQYNALGNANAAYYEAVETEVLASEKLRLVISYFTTYYETKVKINFIQ